jgi:hypothetical protein
MRSRLRIKAFFLALHRSVQASLKYVMEEDPNYHYVSLSPSKYGLFVRFPRRPFELTCNMGESGSVKLSLSEMSELFASIEAACERGDEVRVKFGNHLGWTTDARLEGKDSDRAVIKFSGDMGLGYLGGFSRQQLLSACDEFSRLVERNEADAFEERRH